MRIFWAAIVPSCFVSLVSRELLADGCSGASRAATAGLRAPAVAALRLLLDLRDATRAHGPATLADGEPQTLFHGDGLDKHDAHLRVVARHDHLGALGEGHDAGH